MSLNYLVSDSLIRIKNGLTAKLFSIEVLNSKYIQNILKVLYTEGYIISYNYNHTSELVKKTIEVILKYDIFGQPVIKNITIISKPGLRKYVTLNELIKLRKKNIRLNNIYIISTSKGVVSDLEAIKLNLGGELICKIN